ncbi:MAG: hypothetical protein WAU86_12600 [Oricola sp.]
MKNASVIRMTLAAALLSVASAAQAASKVEKVDVVAEGIDIKPVVVRNNGDYTTFENNTHKYGIRVFAKARGSNTIAMVLLSSAMKEDPTEVRIGHQYFYQSTNDDGWGVYKKSLSPTVKFSQTNWTTDPRKVCKDNLAAKVKAGMKKEDVLKKEWNLTTHAVFGFHAVATTKAQARKGKFVSGDASSATLIYTVPVRCRAKG